MKKACLSFIALMMFVLSSPSFAATFYQHCNYGGYAIELAPGRYDMAQLQAKGIRNDDISSVRLKPGERVQVYQHAGFKGKAWNFNAGDSCFVDNGANDVASSIVVTGTNSSANNLEQRCSGMIQGKVAWNQQGNKKWGGANIKNLCAGTTNPSQTINCFKKGISTHNNWQKAIADCKGSGRAASSTNKGAKIGSSLSNQLLKSTGRQCVKAVFGVGYVAKVRWYDPTHVIMEPVTKSLSLRSGASAVKTENIAVLGTSCIQNSKRMFAQVSVIGGKFANSAITIAAGTVVAIGSGVAGAVVCVGTVGAGCPAAAAAIGAAVSGTVTAASLALPDAKTTFYLGTPGKLEVSGTVWNASAKEVREYGKGKPAGAACSSDGQCANDTCARDSARKGNSSICCHSGREGLFAGHEYCRGLNKGQQCWSDAMCGSGSCKGNMSGLQRGTCG